MHKKGRLYCFKNGCRSSFADVPLFVFSRHLLPKPFPASIVLRGLDPPPPSPGAPPSLPFSLPGGAISGCGVSPAVGSKRVFPWQIAENHLQDIYIYKIYVYMYFFPSATEYFLLGQGICSAVKLSHGPGPADLSPLASGRSSQPAMFCTDSCTPSAITFCCGSGSARNQAGTLHSLEMGEIPSTGCWVQVGTSRLLSEHHQRLGSAWC